MTLPEFIQALGALRGKPVDFDQAELSVSLDVDGERGLTTCSLRVSVGFGKWSVSTYGFGPGRDGTRSGPLGDTEGFRLALESVGEHDGSQGRLRVVR